MTAYRAYCLNFKSDFELRECNRSVDPVEYDFTIRTAKLTPPPLEPTNLFRRGIMAKTAVEPDGSLWLHWEDVATFKAKNGTLLEVHPYTNEPELLSLFTLSEALGLILFHRKLFLLHSSAIQAGDKAWLFMGNPGAGKSSTCAAYVKAGCPLLSDDLTAIYFDSAGRPFVLPAYPQLKIWKQTVDGLKFDLRDLSPVSEGINKYSFQPRNNFPEKPVPLSRMYFLHRNEGQPDFKEIHPGVIPTETLRHFPLPNQFLTVDVLQQYFNHSIRCARSARSFAVRGPDGFDALIQWVEDSLKNQA